MAKQKNPYAEMPKNAWERVGNTTQPGNPLWTEYKNTATGESTLREFTPVKVSAYDICEHYYGPPDAYGNIQCERCHLGGKIVFGPQRIVDGKIVTLHPIG